MVPRASDGRSRDALSPKAGGDIRFVLGRLTMLLEPICGLGDGAEKSRYPRLTAEKTSPSNIGQSIITYSPCVASRCAGPGIPLISAGKA